jgi:hypothetical protein
VWIQPKERVVKTGIIKTVLLATALVTGVGACASGGGTGGTAVYRENLGRVLAGPLEEARLLIWGKHAIPMEREQRSSQNIRVESVWMMRGPEPSEAAAGVLEARNRVILDARALEREMDMSEGPYRATLEVRNEVRSETVPDWHPGPMPDAVRERFREVYNDMRLEVATGVRR